MDSAILVQNIKSRCKANGVLPTVACKESGVGGSFINDIERGRTPSVAKVQMIAAYLGCTVSDLLGEEKRPAPVSGGESLDPITAQLMEYLCQLTPEQKKFLLAQMKTLLENQ